MALKYWGLHEGRAGAYAGDPLPSAGEIVVFEQFLASIFKKVRYVYIVTRGVRQYVLQ